MTHIVDANEIDHRDFSGFGVHFNLDEVRLPAHEVQPRIRFSLRNQSGEVWNDGVAIAGSEFQNALAISTTVFRLPGFAFSKDDAFPDIQVSWFSSRKKGCILGSGRDRIVRIFVFQAACSQYQLGVVLMVP